jgi:hypothetical protein
MNCAQSHVGNRLMYTNYSPWKDIYYVTCYVNSILLEWTVQLEYTLQPMRCRINFVYQKTLSYLSHMQSWHSGLLNEQLENIYRIWSIPSNFETPDTERKKE